MDYASRMLILLGIGVFFSVCPPRAHAFDDALGVPFAWAQQDSLPTRQALFDRFYRERKLLVVFGTSSTDNIEHMRTAIEQSAWRWRMNLQVQHTTETNAGDLDAGATLLIGTPQNNIFLRNLPSSFPVAFEERGFTFFGKTYGQDHDVISLVHPNPKQPQYPLFIMSGQSESALVSALNDRMRSYDYQILRNGQRLRLGQFSQEASTMWGHDPKQDMDFETGIRLVGSTDHVRFFVHNGSIDHSLIADLIQERKATHQKVSAFFETPVALAEPIRYYLYPSLQDKAVVTQSMDFAHLAADQQAVHVAIEPGIRGDVLNKESALLVRSVLGKPHVTALEDGLSLHLSKSWFGVSYEHWMQRIAHAGLAVSARELLINESYEQVSPLMREPQAAALMACMIEAWGKEHVLADYEKWIPQADEWEALEYVWSTCIGSHKASYTPKPPQTKPIPFLKGFNFAHEGYGITNGYGSQSASKALAKLDEMGSNAVSIIPYSFMRDVTQPVPFRLANTAGDENDAAVAHSVIAARELGFTTMIKPQIWVRGSWPGDIDMQTEADTEAFFKYYEQWIGHYAMLAEIFDVEILCIGTELSKMTLGNEELWADLANRLRSIYSGKLTYASNWGEEFESLRFWDALDFVGLDSYYPLSDKPDASEADLRKGARDIVGRIEQVQRRAKKPLILTEIGFPNTDKPWIQPYAENRNAPANAAHQALCYRIMVEAFSGKAWLHGIYWWKWPSYLERGGQDHKGFTPNNKPAEAVIANWYRSF